MTDCAGFEIRVAAEAGPAARCGAGRVVVSIVGELDVASSPDLERELLAVLSSGSKNLVVDTSEVAFIDASGIGVLISAARLARERGGQLALRHPSEATCRVVDLVGLDGALAVERG